MKRTLLILWMACLTFAAARSAGAATEVKSSEWVRFDGTIPPAVADKQSPILKDGYLDVTLYGADPTGREDSTKAIQTAVNDAREYGYIVFFPSGTYLVSDTITCKMAVSRQKPGGDKWLPINWQAHVLEGSTKGPRPVIKLQNNAPGFANESNPKLVLDFWQAFNQQDHVDYRKRHGQSSAFNQTFRKIDIDLGKGNPGAIGIYLSAAQGAALEDSTIRAYGAYAGVYNLPGRSMGAVNLTVLGGRYGIILDGNNISVMAGIHLKGQTDGALRLVNSISPQTLIGFEIEKDEAPAITMHTPGLDTGNHLLMYDGTIKIKNAASNRPAIDNTVANSLYMRNVYVSGTENVVKTGERMAVTGGPGWTRVGEYATCLQGERWAHEMMIDGEIGDQDVIDVHPESDAPPADLLSRHTWDVLPCFEDADAKNVKDSDIGAKGDGVTDDLAAIQKAIDTHEKVFLPAGKYAISGTLRMKKDTKLFGASLKTVQLMQHPTWTPTEEVPMIETDDAADGTAYLGNIFFRADHYNLKHDFVTALHWRVGRNSMVKSIRWAALRWIEGGRKEEANKPGNPIRHIRITDNGGGRWYMIDAIRGYSVRSLNPGQRLVSIEGTTEPLTFYGHDLEGCQSECMTEIADAANVRILAIKIEDHGGWPTLRVRDSKNVFIGASYRSRVQDGKAIFTFINTDQTIGALLSGYSVRPNGSGEDDGEFTERGACVYESWRGEETRLSQTTSCALFKRGEFSDEPWTDR